MKKSILIIGFLLLLGHVINLQIQVNELRDEVIFLSSYENLADVYQRIKECKDQSSDQKDHIFQLQNWVTYLDSKIKK